MDSYPLVNIRVNSISHTESTWIPLIEARINLPTVVDVRIGKGPLAQASSSAVISQ